MMTCIKCKNKSVIKKLCKQHFIEYFENKVYDCIDKYELVKEGDKILVGVSGGKDSLTVLYLLNKKFKNNVTAYSVDEGIAGYRDKSLEDAKFFCEQHNISLITESIKHNFGITLDQTVSNTEKKPCSVCGVFRRYLLNKHREYDLLATGHNMDDEIQSILMNLTKNQMGLLGRCGPKPGIVSSDKFLQRIKPLYFCTEKEVMAYSFLMNFKTSFVECPYAKTSFRAAIRDEINDYESKVNGTKERIIMNFLDLVHDLNIYSDENINKDLSISITLNPITGCNSCGEPTTRELCHACSLKKELRPLILMQ